MFIPTIGGDTLATKYGSLINSNSGLDYFTHFYNQALSVTATFKNDTLSGTFDGTLQYDRTYSYYPLVQRTFFNVTLVQ